MTRPLAAVVSNDKPRFLISDLCVYLESYLTPEQIREVYRAYLFSAEVHEGQNRVSGEPYIYHPVAVARILADMRMDCKCLMAAILHDVIEDSKLVKDQLATVFDEEIAALVDGVSKLRRIDSQTQAEAQAASMQKMLLAMTEDIRVILIKLADRLHNMRTLGALRPDKARRIARETLEIYAPIAHRLGINRIRMELEELGFRAYWPMRYRILKQTVQRSRGSNKALVDSVETAIRQRMEESGLNGEVVGRQKHLYSIYRKMVSKRLSLSEVVDVFAFRIVVDSVDACYRVLGVVHNLYKPVPGRFKDYIAIPKSNGYQSLHTVLFGAQSMPIEIQIRTEDMHRVAEAGVAAHWLYKSGGEDQGSVSARAKDWLQNVLELQKAAGDSVEFLEHVKVDLFPDEVYVFTPKGAIKVLPKGATVVDFAYAVHSDIGNTCVAARIDRRMVPLSTKLYNGQTVEVLNSTMGKPKAVWLNFVVTSKARANIRSYLKNLERQDAEEIGRQLIEKELSAQKATLETFNGEAVALYLKESNLATVDDLLVEIGLGNRLPKLVARRLLGAEPAELAKDASGGLSVRHLAIRGTEGMVVRYAKCCRPIPKDAITGVFSVGKGIVVHRQGCRNLGDYQRHGENWLDVEWDDTVDTEFSTEIRVEVSNSRGVLATLASIIAEMGSNIDHVSTRDRDGLSSTIEFVISVHSREHLARIMRRMKAQPNVMRISRTRG